MKFNPGNRFLARLRSVCVVSAAAFQWALVPSAGAIDLYWDIDGATEGAGGAEPSGNWEEFNWSSSPEGSVDPLDWLDGDAAFFAAGTNATGSYTVTLSTTTTLAKLVVQEGSPVISGTGTLVLGAAATPFEIAADATGTVATAISGEGRGIETSGPGTLVLDGSGSFDGTIRMNGGKLVISGSYPAVEGLTFGWVDGNAVQNLDIVEGADVTTEKFVMADLYYTENTVAHTGGTLSITGTNDANSTSASFLMGHWGYGTTCVYGLSGGTLNSLGARLSLGWDRTDVKFNQSGGTANLLGLNLDNGRANPAAYNLTGGRLNLGSGGINNQVNKAVNIGTATLGAINSWTSSKPLTLTGGTLTVDSLDALDGTTERTISLHGGITETAPSSLVKTGEGRLSLSGTPAYSGDTIIEGGTLLPGPDLTNTDIVVQAGGSLGAGTSLLAGTSLVNNVELAGGDLAFRVGNAFDTLDILTLNVTAPSTVTLEPTQPVTAGDVFPVVKYVTLSGLGFGGLSAGLSNPHYSAEMVHDTETQEISLKVTGSDTIVWKGTAATGGNVWDVDASANWKLSSALPAVTPSKFYDFDIVTFDDSSTTGTVVLSGALRPATITVDSSVTNYSFSGSPIGGSASLTKFGSSTLTLATANTFSGPVEIAEGRVVAGTATSLGTGTTPVQLGDGAVIEFGASFTTARGISLMGATGGIDIGADKTVTLASPVSGGGVVTKSGDGVLRFSTYGNNSFGGASIIVDGGALEMAGAAFNTNIGLASVTVNEGAELRLAEGSAHALGGAFTVSPTVNLEGGTLKIAREQYFDAFTTRGGLVMADGTVPEFRSDDALSITSLASPEPSVFSGVILQYVTAPFVFDVEDGAAAEDLVLSNVSYVLGTTSVTKNGPGTMVTSGTIGYTGETIVTEGVLRIPAGSTKAITVGASGVATAITGAGAVEIDGTFTLDLTGASLGNGSQWALVATATKSFGDSFAITGFTEVAGVHTLEAGDLTWTFSEETGILSLESPGTAYDGYEAANNITGAGPDADSDGDGVANGVEFVIGGISDPARNSPSLALLPQLRDDGANVIFTFHLTDAAASIDPDIWSVEFDDDLAGEWTVAVAPDNATIGITPDGNGPDGQPWSKVEVTLPKAGVPVRFARLRVNLTSSP